MTVIHKHAATPTSEGLGSADATETALEQSPRRSDCDAMDTMGAAKPAAAPAPVGLQPGIAILARPAPNGLGLQSPGRSEDLSSLSAPMLLGPAAAPAALLEARRQQAVSRAQVALERLSLPHSDADALTPIAAREVAPIAASSPVSALLSRVPRSISTIAMGSYSVAAVHEQGRRAEMEDATAVAWFEEDSLGVAAVFDGHGGAATANQAASLIGPVLQAHLRRIPSNKRHLTDLVVTTIQDAFASVDEDQRGPRRFWHAAGGSPGKIAWRHQPLPSLHRILRNSHRAAVTQAATDKARFISGAGGVPDAAVLRAARSSGSAALVAVFWQDTLYLANLGDSRAVLVRDDGTAWRLSKDQKPEDEMALVQQRGGSVAYVEGAYRVDRAVAMARALGDYTLAVGRRPQVTPVSLLDKDHCALMLGCDGVFDCIHDDVHAAYIHEKMQAGVSPERIASDLVNASHARDSRDNMSVLLIPLKRGG
jgi:serine/threonine protein phosphatase PrpC